MYSTGQLILIAFIMLEFFLVFIFIAMVYMAKLNVYIRKKMNQKKYLNYSILLQAYQQNFDIGQFSTVTDFGIFLHMLKESKLSEGQKSEVVANIILPNQIRNLKAKDWRKRFNLITCFRYHMNERYYPALIQLIQDEIPVIRINAVHIGSAVTNEQIYQAILEKMLNEDQGSRTLYINNFYKNEAILPYLLTQLEQSNDIKLKKIIYDILLHIGCDVSFYPIAKEDSLHGKKDMRLAAIRVLPLTDQKNAIPILTALLEDEQWMVRNVAVQALAKVNDNEVIPLIAEKLKDKAWWVRVSAAKMLTSVGDKGLQILEEYNEYVPKEISIFTSYFLDIAEIKGEQHA